MWLLFALSVISKLDTVPLICTLSMIHLWENRTVYFGHGWQKPWIEGVKYAGVPILLFIGLTFFLFDGPLPQSAYSKLYLHSHPSGHWFPFLELMVDQEARAALFVFSLIFPAIHLMLGIRNNVFRLRDFSLFIGFAATMLLFYIYNPGERMNWYYAMPRPSDPSPGLLF